MTYGKELNLQKGDHIRISSPAKEPFPAGWAEGTVISANYYDDAVGGGWYIEMNKENVSPGWQTGYSYFKEREDEVTIEKFTPVLPVYVVPKYNTLIMDKVRQHLGLEPGDSSRDTEINDMSRDMVFDHCLEWEGLIGYGYQVRSWIEDIYGVNVSTFGV